LISTRFPGNDAIEQITGWVRELSSIRVFGSPEPNVLGIKGIDDIYLKVLAFCLKGCPNDEVKVLLAQEWPDKNIDENITNVIETTIFKSLFPTDCKSARETLASN
jgi:hypothetical protein